jgi:hypothetical protein
MAKIIQQFISFCIGRTNPLARSGHRRHPAPHGQKMDSTTKMLCTESNAPLRLRIPTPPARPWAEARGDQKQLLYRELLYRQKQKRNRARVLSPHP